nr:uncharacterized protein LOC111104540 isoform X2 [Crassostrea virginica]XP_022294260.1 uncharacterized protein LOC111104540 isoform X2 [Crassostrea virginica]XP_022294263.1 uncharacterized protein LOC111104540 isoform X2 [Crassostrea virginica]
MHSVEGCPNNLTELEARSDRLGCGDDKYGNNQYICLPNVEKTSLVEFCFNGIMGIIAKGNCLETSNQSLVLRDCTAFKFGCPEEHTKSTDFYKYPACQTIDTKHRCYILNPSCQKSDVGDGNENSVTLFTYLLLTGIVVYTLFFLFMCIRLLYRIKKGRRQQKKGEKVESGKHTLKTKDKSKYVNQSKAFNNLPIEITAVSDGKYYSVQTHPGAGNNTGKPRKDRPQVAQIDFPNLQKTDAISYCSSVISDDIYAETSLTTKPVNQSLYPKILGSQSSLLSGDQ